MKLEQHFVIQAEEQDAKYVFSLIVEFLRRGFKFWEAKIENGYLEIWLFKYIEKNPTDLLANELKEICSTSNT